ncbi:TonB-dependent siderophore receptor [Motilimonas sp. 1_MG-2023]|uniref:TonB-dependent siderophore receptor n=1 Tax=Motilimonas sp. 1_MG-2023 TaxID=3062672 RepID=UPI0026E1F06D|nr:TonB-dependent siderophore receptor [Motilimonas sp. 1_MG-2023]MDO6527277.1 TonB-dependent siderophore receptor [Motilimonas sp. 1_MG-2023]
MPFPIIYKRTALASMISTILYQPLVYAEQGTTNNATGESAEEVQTMTVLGQAYRNTATKTSLDVYETPQAISVIDAEMLEQRDVSSVAEALRYVPGVNTELRGGAVTRLDLFNIRGFDNYQNFYDGLPLMYNGWNLQPQIDPVMLEQIEVFKGPTSVLYGSTPPGGMVNMIAKSPQREAKHGISVKTGSYQRKELMFDSTGQIAQSNLAYRVVGLVRQKEGQADTSEEERWVFAPSLDWQMSDSTLLNVNMYYQNDPSAGIYTTVPAAGSVKPHPMGNLSPSTFLGDENWNTYEREVLLLGYKLLHDLNDNWQFLQNTRYMDASAYQENMYNNPAGLALDQSTIGRHAYLTDETSNSLAIDNQLSGRIAVGEMEHHLLLGIDYQALSSDVIYKDTSDGYSLMVDVFQPNHQAIDRDSLTFNYGSDVKLETRQLGFYAQDQMRFNQWVVIAGVRYDKFTSETKANSVYSGNASSSRDKVDQDNLSFRVGGLYEFNNGFAPYISYAESFEPVSGIDKAGSGFDPTTGHQWEAGLKYSDESLAHTANLAVFHITKEDSLVSDPNNIYGPKMQSGEIVSKGVEFESQHELTDNLGIALNYTWIDMEITKDTTGLQGKTPVWVPEQTASLWANYQFYQGALSGTQIGTGLRYVGETQMDSMNTDTVPSYTLVDLTLSYDLANVSTSLAGAKASLAATNLLNKEYYSCYDQANCWFGEERSVEASVSLTF